MLRCAPGREALDELRDFQRGRRGLRSSIADRAPARAQACSSVYVVMTPKVAGTPVVRATWRIPAAASRATCSKCGVSPRITTPTHTMPAYRRVAARWSAAWGSSNEPGTQCSSTASAGTLATAKTWRAPSTRRVTMDSLKRAATMAKRHAWPGPEGSTRGRGAGPRHHSASGERSPLPPTPPNGGPWRSSPHAPLARQPSLPNGGQRWYFPAHRWRGDRPSPTPPNGGPWCSSPHAPMARRPSLPDGATCRVSPRPDAGRPDIPRRVTVAVISPALNPAGM